MKGRLNSAIGAVTVSLLLSLSLLGCKEQKPDASAEGPAKVTVEQQMNPNDFRVDRPERFPLTTATEYKEPAALNVTGVVNPDIARAVPVISLAAGRVVEIKARLGDQVKKGQVLLRVRSNDVSGAYDVYLKAENDERLARVQYERAQVLYERGAIAKSALDIAEDTAKDARVDLDTAAEQLRLLGVDKDHPSGIVDIIAPVSGVVTDQQVTNAAGVQGLPGPNPFTISDLSYVWIMCDVYENDLDAVKLGDTADIHLNAYPNRLLKGRVDNIFPILDPNIRTAKVRLEVPNPGRLMSIGMFVTATFYGKKPEIRAAIPADAVLHLRDSDWVYVPLDGNRFRRQKVVAGKMLPDEMQEIVSGLQPGAKVVQRALIFQSSVEQ